jgi:hypothetical protein
VRVTYTAKRNLASGHSAAVAYSIDLYATVIPTLTPEVRQAVAIDGTLETVLSRITRTYDVQTDFFTDSGSPSTLDLVNEWIASVMGGEQFEFDADRVPGGSAVAPVDVTLAPGPVTPARTGPALYSIAVTLREVDAIL